MGQVLRIRGIYATALTAFFLDCGFKVALPSEPVAERFAGAEGFDVFQAPDAEIADLDSKQGILVLGEEEALVELSRVIGETLFDSITRRKAKDVLEIEFPFHAKARLDEIRSTVLPTLSLHHRLKIIATDQVDAVEGTTLCHSPELRETASRAMEQRLIWNNYKIGNEIAIEHVKPEGKVLHLSEGVVVEADFAGKRLVLKRSRFKGGNRYDGLGILKQAGDYALSEIREGDWFYKHTYFRAEGERIGAYYNINTPVEFYPDRIRYVDLEIDVVQFPDGRTQVVDEGKLEKRFEQGYLTAALRKRVIGEASALLHSPDPPPLGKWGQTPCPESPHESR